MSFAIMVTTKNGKVFPDTHKYLRYDHRFIVNHQHEELIENADMYKTKAEAMFYLGILKEEYRDYGSGLYGELSIVEAPDE